MPGSTRKTKCQLNREIDAALSDPGRTAPVVAQPRSQPGDHPELWSDQELAERIRRHLRRGETSLKNVRAFGVMMDEAIERERAVGATGTRDEIWGSLLVRHGA